MTIGGLLPGQKTHKHRHTYETILYVLEGKGWTLVENERVEWEAGDAVYIPSWAWHQHQNTSESESAKYIACENAPQLQNLGVALREEEGRDF
jgi:gentisate 1,2-dioxygenase